MLTRLCAFDWLQTYVHGLAVVHFCGLETLQKNCLGIVLVHSLRKCQSWLFQFAALLALFPVLVLLIFAKKVDHIIVLEGTQAFISAKLTLFVVPTILVILD